MNRCRRRLAKQRRRARDARAVTAMYHPYGVDNTGALVWYTRGRFVTIDGKPWRGQRMYRRAAGGAVPFLVKATTRGVSRADVGDVVDVEGAHLFVEAKRIEKDDEGTRTHLSFACEELP